MSSDLEFFSLTAAAIIGCVLLVFAIAYTGASWDCGKFGDATGMPTKMSGTVCYAQIDGQWVPSQMAIELRVRVREAK